MIVPASARAADTASARVRPSLIIGGHRHAGPRLSARLRARGLPLSGCSAASEHGHRRPDARRPAMLRTCAAMGGRQRGRLRARRRGGAGRGRLPPRQHRGAVNLAAACRRRGLPLVTFSSDLVFDGAPAARTSEERRALPLNVYGASKAEAERRVLELLPGALVVRTSAFFGPWDEYNSCARLFARLDRGDTFDAAADNTVSPTYVPDLVHAALDLLIDGERGIWHLANEGAVTWVEFARRAAELADRPLDLIRPVTTAQAWGPARRPAYSALSSARGIVLPGIDEALVSHRRDSDSPRARPCRPLRALR